MSKPVELIITGGVPDNVVDLVVEGMDEKVVQDFRQVAELLELNSAELLEGLMKEFVASVREEWKETFEKATGEPDPLDELFECNRQEGGDI